MRRDFLQRLEMAHACRLDGSEVVDIVHMSELMADDKRIEDYHFLEMRCNISEAT